MKKKPSRPTFSNASNLQPLSIKQMARHLQTFSRWPIDIGGTYYYKHDGKLKPIQSSAELMALIDKKATTRWDRTAITKEEFFAGLRDYVPRFTWQTDYPHFPPIEGVYYNCTNPTAKNTGKLDAFLKFFTPATPEDRALLKAMILTFFWSGPPGARPMFAIVAADSTKHHPQGTGKSACIQLCAELAGGYISVASHGDGDRFKTRLLSAEGLARRIVLIDNVKSSRLSSEVLESFVTDREINGHRLYHGQASRPNYMTTVVTVNGPAFSKDMADRAVVIRLKPPERNPRWLDSVTEFIEMHRNEILADIHFCLSSGTKMLKRVDRWATWAKEVLGRATASPSRILELISARRHEIDEDDQDAADFEMHLRACIKRAAIRSDADQQHCVIPSPLMSQWVQEYHRDLTVRKAQQYASRLRLKCLKKHRTSTGWEYRWKGAKVPDNSQPKLLKYSVPSRGDRVSQ
jgi:hypothetical protein